MWQVSSGKSAGLVSATVVGSKSMPLSASSVRQSAISGSRFGRQAGTIVVGSFARATSTLSRHAYGDAIDIYGFWFEDGSTAILEEDWDHDTSSQSSWEGQMLYDAAYRWHDNKYWNIILTPNYNSVHDNHFHVDLTPNRDSIAFWEPFFIGPNTGH